MKIVKALLIPTITLACLGLAGYGVVKLAEEVDDSDFYA